jgi:hypothetical protein
MNNILLVALVIGAAIFAPFEAADAQEYEITGTISTQQISIQQQGVNPGNVPAPQQDGPPVWDSAQIDGPTGTAAVFYFSAANGLVTSSSIENVITAPGGQITYNASGNVTFVTQGSCCEMGHDTGASLSDNFTFNDAPNTLQITMTQQLPFNEGNYLLNYITTISNAAVSLVQTTASAPEIDPASGVAAITLLIGILLVLHSRHEKKREECNYDWTRQTIDQ